MRIHDDWFLTPQRAAVHLPTQTAVIADVHLGYNESRRDKGDAVPLVPIAEQLAPLQTLADAGIRKCVVAGDLIESSGQAHMVAIFVNEMCNIGLEITAVVPGNHDADSLSKYVPTCADGMQLGDWTVMHGDREMPGTAIVHGHIHPSAFVRGRKVPCFLFRANRLILPAYSQDAAGVSSRRVAIGDDFDRCAILENRVQRLFGRR